MMNSCTVEIEYYDKKTNRVQSRNKRENAIFSIRKINGGFEISVKTARSNDLFITEKPIVSDKLLEEGKISIRIPENRCSLCIKNADESSLETLLGVLSHSSPGIQKRNIMPQPQRKQLNDDIDNIPEDNEENIPPRSQNINNVPRPPFESPASKNSCTKSFGILNDTSPNTERTPGKCTPKKVPGRYSPRNVPERLSPNKVPGKLSTPIKRRIFLGTGTPSKNIPGLGGMFSKSSPNNLR